MNDMMEQVLKRYRKRERKKTKVSKKREKEMRKRKERVEKNDEGIINRISVKKTSITFFLLSFSSRFLLISL